ncbi:MAG: phosphoribosyltransferase family protein [Flavobacteriaceae bacterium]
MKDLILGHEAIQHKINSIAYQIYESNVHETKIVIAGINGGGSLFAEKIISVLQRITQAEILTCTVDMDKKNPLSMPIKTSIPLEELTNCSLVLVDDVLNSGTTLIYGVHHFLQIPLKKLKTAVLVNRNHKKFPVKADFKGISLSTSLNEHIDVVLDQDRDAVYLSQ